MMGKEVIDLVFDVCGREAYISHVVALEMEHRSDMEAAQVCLIQSESTFFKPSSHPYYTISTVLTERQPLLSLVTSVLNFYSVSVKAAQTP